MATVDLKDAYFLVPISNESKKYLRFKFKNDTYEFQCLPFGLSLAPLIFTKILKPVLSALRSNGFLMVAYLEDFICLGSTYSKCLSCVTETVTLLEKIGFVINTEKSKLIPNQVQTYLGFKIDSQNMCLRLPEEKSMKILERLKVTSKLRIISIREFAKLLGMLCSACPAIAYGWLYTKRLEREKFLALKSSSDDYDCQMNLNCNLQPDFKWWIKNIQISYNPIRNGNFELEIF